MRPRARLRILALSLLGAGPCFAQDGSVADETTRAAHARFGFERVALPGGERIGLAGTSYLVDLPLGGWAAGPAVYASVSGQRGGFYTLGGEVAWHRPLFGPIGVELGLYAGGGGGGGAPQGGGLMLRPHAAVSWDLGPGSLALSLSRVRFPNGRIDSTQLGLAATIDTAFRDVPGDASESRVATGDRSGLGFDRVVAVAGVYRPRARSLFLDGTSLPRAIDTIGVRAERDVGRHAYWGLEANGAVNGRVAGYAEYLATAGLRSTLIADRLDVGLRVALGTGGGGAVSVGGGVLAKAALGATLQLAPHQSVQADAGFADAPRGSFRATQASLAWLWTVDGPGAGAVPVAAARTEFAAGLETVGTLRSDERSQRIVADVLKVRRFVSPGLYLGGQAGSAVSGGAGGYSVGLFGVGWNEPLPDPRWQVSAELLAGAGGGGGVTSGGAVAQAMAFASYRLGPSLTLSLGAGRMQSLRRSFASTAVDASIAFSYGATNGAP